MPVLFSSYTDVLSYREKMDFDCALDSVELSRCRIPSIRQRSSHDYYSSPDHEKLPHKRKVFILHFNGIADVRGKAIMKLAVKLREMCVDVTIDLFEYDTPPKNWTAWYEQKLRESDVVLCMIDEMFYNNLTSGSRVVGYTVYNLMNDPNSDVTFRAVFLDMPKRMEYVPPAMQGGTSYCLSTSCLSIESEEFTSLYAYLTGQNRMQKPKLGQMVKLAPKAGRFHQQQVSQHVTSMSTDIAQQQMHSYHDQFSSHTQITKNTSMQDQNRQANLIFNLLRDDSTQISTLPSHQRMLMSLATNLVAEWEALGRILDVSEADLYAIKRDYMYSVQEQAVQVLRKWLDKNGSKATLGVLITAIYSLGPPYWNLLDIVSKYAPEV